MRLRLSLLAAAASLLAAMGWPGSATADDRWQWPLAGQPTVARAFDQPAERWLAGHRGVDLRARSGDSVLAAGSGVIGYAALLAGRGVVTIHHADGLETTYEPVQASVRRGDQVRAGQPIGHLRPGHGNCGIGFVCLHWGLRRGASYLDPLQLIRGTRVRLLPIYDQPSASTPRSPAQLPTASPAASRATADAPRQKRAPPVLPVAAALGSLAAGGVFAARRRSRA
ncbi:MAG: hypothetical protein QOG53_2362 [Frankiales bacterium]|nr:hypothetical protein [Frankiales bacterium]